jgi:hypothetical protein
VDTAADVAVTGSAGDVDNDGFCDAAVGGTAFSSYTGKVCVYRGSASMGSTPYVTMTGEGTSNYFGTGLASGDVNGDGLSDIIVGASAYNSSSGRVSVFYGGSLAGPPWTPPRTSLSME